MLVMPAIDLRDGACVQLVGGRYDAERIREADPIGVARRWRDAGFTRLHVVDLDAALGVGSNADVVSELARMPGLQVQVGGGLRTTEAVEGVLSAGAAAVVLGTRALEDPAWLTAVASRWPGRIVVALDVRAGRPVLRGWTSDAGTTMEAALERQAALPLAGVLCTCVDVEGAMKGPDLALMERVRAATTGPVVASGGIATLEDLRALRGRGVNAAVVGMALYMGTLDARATAEEFGG